MSQAAIPPPDIEGLTYINKLGSGGFADVFLYQQASPQRKVAVKVLRDRELAPETVRSFTAEADAMAQLEHPHIVPVYATGTTRDRRPYIVMMYYSRSSLADRLRHEQFSVPETLQLGIQLGSAVETAHRAGLLHRDIKPANVLVNAYGKPGLTDFGIAGRVTDEDDPEIGISVPWAPPEALYGSSPISVRSDVYSLAATLWHLLVGRSPFVQPGGDNSANALMKRIRNVPPPSTGRGDVPASLERLLTSAMAKNPQVRPASVKEFIHNLQAIEQELRLPRTPIELAEDTSYFMSHPDPAQRAESTRRRGATVHPEPATAHTAQRSFTPVSPAPMPAPNAPVDNTWQRESAEVTRRPERLETEDAPAEDASSPTGWTKWVVVAVVLLLTAGIVLAVVLNGGSTPEPKPTPTITPVAPGLNDVIPPGPPTVNARREGKTVTFTWSYSSAMETDQVRWRTPGSKDANVATGKTVEVPAPGPAKVCIEIQVSRMDGSFTQPDWTKACG